MNTLLGAVILTGGRSSRMGSPKELLHRDGATLLQHTVRAARAGGAHHVAVVGDADRAAGALGDERAHVLVVREDPPHGGPAAGLLTGARCLAALDPAPGTLLALAVDLVDPEQVVAALTSAAPGRDGVILVDDTGWRQPLAARYRTAALAGLDGDGQGRSARGLVAGLDLAEVTVPAALVADADTPEQARAAGWSVAP